MDRAAADKCGDVQLQNEFKVSDSEVNGLSSMD